MKRSKDEERLWQLMARQLAGEATDAELNELQQLLQKYPNATWPSDVLNNLWSNSEKDTSPDIEKAFARHLQRMTEQGEPMPESEPASTDAEPLTWTNRPTKKEKLLSWLNGNGKLSGYVKITWRNLARSKVFSAVNITGLAIGMAGAILILLWIQNELSFDLFHQKKDRIYQVYTTSLADGKKYVWNATPMVIGPALAQYNEVEQATRVNWVAAFILKTPGKQLQTHGYVTDAAFLTMFNFPLVQGNTATALSAPHSIVLTEACAKKLFGHTDVLGEVVRIDSNALFSVTGVAKDLPNNTQFNFEYLVPWSYMKEVGWDNANWIAGSTADTYVLLKPGVPETVANSRFRNIIKTHAPGLTNEVFLHPLRKWRLWSRFENGKVAGGNIDGVRLLGIIAAFILLIACINYMNLSTARSVKRAREVGIRKVAGAGRSVLIKQFLGESVMIAFLAALLSLVIVVIAMPGFNYITEKELKIPFASPAFWLCGLAFIVFTGMLAGSYPAFYLSAFQPVTVLKGTFKAAKALITPRKALVVVQFTFAIILIICTIVVYRQIAYGQKRDTGFDMNQLAFVYNKGDVQKNYPAIKDELLRSGAITSIARSGSPITEIWIADQEFRWPGKNPDLQSMFIKFYTDGNFTKTMGLTIKAGRDINAEAYATDTNAIVLNESAVRLMGFKNPIGQTISNPEGNWHVVGVVNNFVPGLPWDPVYPMVIAGPRIKGWFGTVTFRLNPQNSTKHNLATIRSIFKKYNPDYPFDYFFVKEMYAAKFEGTLHTGLLAAIFAGLTIFISCLGLFALATYMAENRIKEIGIRKVLGASITTITTLLSKDFLKLVLLAFVIASPLAWWAMHNWLQHFEYRIHISWWIFGCTGLLSACIALATVSYQAIKAALANPVNALRSE